jgi:hypothetical protein
MATIVFFFDERRSVSLGYGRSFTEFLSFAFIPVNTAVLHSARTQQRFAAIGRAIAIGTDVDTRTDADGRN